MMESWGEFMNPIRCKSIYHRRCDAIEHRLKEHNICAVVSRHTAFDVEYYVLDIKDNIADINRCEIADALDIPKDWVDFINIYDEGVVYFIKEDEFNDKYCDCDGEIDWGFNLFDLKFGEYETVRLIKDRLENVGITVESVGIYDDYLMINIDGCPKCSIAKALNCPESMVNCAITTPQHRLYVIPRWDR